MGVVKNVWRSTDCVCLDVDSTVCVDETIDELAKFLGVGEDVARITSNAMLGGMSYKDSLRQRLDMMQPSVEDIEKFNQTQRPQLTPGIKELVSHLHKRGVDVYLITGGFLCLIEPMAKLLNIPKKNVFSNRLKFFYNGSYAGFDESQPTCAKGGKPKIIQGLKEKFKYEHVVHIGDGTTDLEAAAVADAFIGFGGNQVRPTVRDNADWFVMSFKELLDELRRDSSQHGD